MNKRLKLGWLRNRLSSTELSNVQLVTLAVYHLGGEVNAVDIEDVAVQAFQKNPEKFSWKKYPEMIDKGVVQFALKDASLPKKGMPLLSGSIKHGYMLTTYGSAWVKTVEGNFDTRVEFSFRSASTNEKLILERTRLETSAAFRKFSSGDLSTINEVDFQEFSRVNEYFPEHARLRRFNIIESAIQDSPELTACWRYLKAKFS